MYTYSEMIKSVFTFNLLLGSINVQNIFYTTVQNIFYTLSRLILQLERAVRAEGSVESWLTCLLQMSQQSLHSIIRTAYTSLNDPSFHLLQFLDKMPAQVGDSQNASLKFAPARLFRVQKHPRSRRSAQ